MNLSDQDLWERVKHDDLRAFEFLFNTYQKGLYAYAYDLIQNKEDSEEIILDVFSHIWNERAVIFIHSSLKAYLYRSVHNKCINHIKQVRRLQEKVTDFHKETTYAFGLILNSNQEFALDKLIANDLEKRIDDAIAGLSDQCKQVFCLSRYEQKKLGEIALLMNISENTVKTYLMRALKKIKECLEEQQG